MLSFKQGEVVTGSANSALMETSTLEGWNITSRLNQWSASSPHHCSSIQHHVIHLQLLVLTYVMNLLFGTFSYIIVCLYFGARLSMVDSAFIQGSSANFCSLWKLTTFVPLLNRFLYTRISSFLFHATLKSSRTAKRSCDVLLGSLGVQLDHPSSCTSWLHGGKKNDLWSMISFSIAFI